MGLLKDYPFLPVLDTSSNDLIQDFFVPALSRSVQYDRGVGFFSSAWMKIASRGMVQFASNGGKARWVTSPILDENDWHALLTGDLARQDILIYTSLIKSIGELQNALDDDTLSALSWMVADGILSFKLALPRNKLEKGDFHDKFGVFTDKIGDQISFNGSYNDSVQGTRNYESIKVFTSWNPAFTSFVRSDADRFTNLWENKDPNVATYDLPSAAKEKILELRKSDRPYSPPPWISQSSFVHKPVKPQIPSNYVIRKYQTDAITAWFDNDCCGLFEMATGTGKTITSLAASIQLYHQKKKLVVIVACPYQHLVDQWVEEARRFGYSPIHAYKSRTTWLDEVHERIIKYNHEDVDNVCIVTTHATFATDHFRETLNRIDGPALLIADEAHHLSTERQMPYLPDKIDYRLALSATPDRWFQGDSTVSLHDYFGKTVFSLPLAEAITGGFLTPYYYHPVLVELTDDEMIEYRDLSSKIGGLLAQQRSSSQDEYLQRLLIKRSQLLNSASNKLLELEKLIDKQKKISNTLFYCAPGGQIDDVVHLLGWEKRIKVHRFTFEEDTITRQTLLRDFANNKLQALVAIRCLDEGVDVPNTRIAFILASSSNPREFIQRRGRILRKSPGKEHAIIFDLIAIPPVNSITDNDSKTAERSLLRRELKRFAEFANSAINMQAAYQVIWGLAQEYNIFDFDL